MRGKQFLAETNIFVLSFMTALLYIILYLKFHQDRTRFSRPLLSYLLKMPK